MSVNRNSKSRQNNRLQYTKWCDNVFVVEIYIFSQPWFVFKRSINCQLLLLLRTDHYNIILFYNITEFRNIYSQSTLIINCLHSKRNLNSTKPFYEPCKWSLKSMKSMFDVRSTSTKQ